MGNIFACGKSSLVWRHQHYDDESSSIENIDNVRVYNNNLTVEKIKGIVATAIGNQTTDRYTVRIDSKSGNKEILGEVVVGFYTSYYDEKYKATIKYYIYYNGKSNYNGKSTLSVTGETSSHSDTRFYELCNCGLCVDKEGEELKNGDYITLIREGNIMRVEKNKVNIKLVHLNRDHKPIFPFDPKEFFTMPNTPLFPAVEFKYSNHTTCDATVTLVQYY